MLDRTPRLRRARAHRRPWTAVVLALGAIVLASCGDTGPDNRQNALRPEGRSAQKILDLTRPFFWVAVVIGAGVIGMTVYVALRFRVKPGEERAPVQVHGNSALEISWTIVPGLILLVMAVPTIATVFDLAKQPAGADVVPVTVTARQWWWEFHYDQSNIETANELHIPAGRDVALALHGPPLCTAPCYGEGVIHSFWVPSLAGKIDVVPGRTHHLTLHADQPGTYLGQCAEYCGLAHADMRLRVIAQTPADYERWTREQLVAPSRARLLAGVQNEKWGCASCHSFDPKTPGAVGPNLTHLADRTTFAAGKYDLTGPDRYENLWRWVYDAPGRKPMGNLQSHMPAFKDQGMTEQDAKDIACFLLENTATNPDPPAECTT